jgi:hypothetical protein
METTDNIRSLYPYKVKHCNTQEEISQALNYYIQTLAEEKDLSSTDHHNMEQICWALRQKQTGTVVSYTPTVHLHELKPADVTRQEAYYELLRLIPNFFIIKNNPDRDLWFVTRCFELWIKALELENYCWESAMLSKTTDFYKCGTINEKVVFLIHDVLSSGLHAHTSVMKQINLAIKLVYALKIENYIGVILPNPKNINYNYRFSTNL